MRKVWKLIHNKTSDFVQAVCNYHWKVYLLQSTILTHYFMNTICLPYWNSLIIKMNQNLIFHTRPVNSVRFLTASSSVFWKVITLSMGGALCLVCYNVSSFSNPKYQPKEATNKRLAINKYNCMTEPAHMMSECCSKILTFDNRWWKGQQL